MLVARANSWENNLREPCRTVEQRGASAWSSLEMPGGPGWQAQGQELCLLQFGFSWASGEKATKAVSLLWARYTCDLLQFPLCF